MIEESAKRARPELSYSDAELVLGLVYPVGTDSSGIQLTLENYVKRFNYRPSAIKLSDYIVEILKKVNIGLALDDSSEAARIETRMTAGNKLCEIAKDKSFIVAAAMADISRLRRFSSELGAREPLPRTVHILLSLKRPEEVEFLRAIYGPGFYLIGVFASELDRFQYLTRDKNIHPKEALRLMRRDEEEAGEYGQHSRKAFELADVFIELKGDQYKGQLERFLDLVFGNPYLTPEPDEHAMFLAYSASLRSGQLARQVGAAIRSSFGDIISLGCNDVPFAGGGLYWPGPLDARDHIKGFDSNDLEQAEMVKDVLSKLSITSDLKTAIKKLQQSRLMDITEYGRAVHAEMDALLTCARTGANTLGGSLFTTTFPCHNCTRHIIAAGLKRVVYIEPYPKSMASKLHQDAIVLPGTRSSMTSDNRHRIPFEPFFGIGPRRFYDLFSMRMSSGHPIKRKNDEGRTLPWKREGGTLRIEMLPTSYIQREKVAAARFRSTVDNLVEDQRGVQRFKFPEE